jgi:hypothetical protein
LIDGHWPAVSTPSATTFSPRLCPKANTVRAMAASLGSVIAHKRLIDLELLQRQ